MFAMPLISVLSDRTHAIGPSYPVDGWRVCHVRALIALILGREYRGIIVLCIFWVFTTVRLCDAFRAVGKRRQRTGARQSSSA